MGLRPSALSLAVLLFVVLRGLPACNADPEALQPDGSADIHVPDGNGGLDIPTSDTPDPDVVLPKDTADAEANSDAADSGPDDADASDAGDSGDSEVVTATLEARACTHELVYTPAPGETPAAVHVPGSFNGWDVEGTPLAEGADGVWRGSLDMAELAPGSYGYKILVGADGWQLDPTNIMKRFDDGIENSKLLVPDCDVPALELLERTVDGVAGSAVVEVAVRTGVGGQYTPGSAKATHNGQPVAGAWNPATGTLRVELTGLPLGKHELRFDASGPAGDAEQLLVSFWVEPEPFEWRDAVLYFAFVDRFRDGDPATGSKLPCTEADPLGNWLGGDWKGITEKIEEGYFDDLGVNALWLSAPMDNPDECVDGIGGYTYTAYHGYFPQDLYAPEEHFGTMADLRELVSAAHSRGIRVLVDLVANHVYETAPSWLEHEFDGWFNTPIYVCGWDQPETCWFQPYLPDFNHRNDAVVEYVSDAALWWAKELGLDGFRVDAVKHIHPFFLNTLRWKLDTQIEAYQDNVFWTVGETFVGEWGGGSGSEEALIKEYIGDDRLYGQFDFPLYWALVKAVGRHEAPMSALGDVLSGVSGYYGDGTIMASFLGNHDVPRFVSHAAGQIADVWGNGATQQGWEDPPVQPSASEPYSRLEQAFVFLAAAPWVPLIYYGDEIGLAGAGDPDNRRMMVWDGVSAEQEGVRDVVGKLMKARAGSLALRRGDVTVVESDEDLLVVRRVHAGSGDVAVAVICRDGAGCPGTVEVPVPLSDGAVLVDVLSGEEFVVAGGVVVVGGGGLALLVRGAD